MKEDDRLRKRASTIIIAGVLTIVGTGILAFLFKDSSVIRIVALIGIIACLVIFFFIILYMKDLMKDWFG